ncbi:MAG: hypothetical protein JWP87_1841 [Labilithrix sp.]|nr:hypothetical protein [Labilithrix sp.]
MNTLRALALFSGFSIAALAGCEDCNKGGATPVATDAGAPSSPLTVVDGGTSALPEGGTINATPLPTASVKAMVNPDQLPPYTGPTGSVEGTITVIGDPAPATPNDFSRCPDAEKTWGHAFREGPPGPNGARPLADALVVVTGYKGFYLPEKNEAKEIRIENCAYTTRALTLTFGQRIEVRNLSKDFWTPMLEPGPSLVLMMATPNGDPTKIYPKKPGHFLLLDRDRKYVSVDVYAFLHPLHTASSTTGYYRIDGLPVGKVKVSTTHSQIDSTAEVELNVLEGVVHKVDLQLKNVNKEAGARASDAGGDAAPRPLR